MPKKVTEKPAKNRDIRSFFGTPQASSQASQASQASQSAPPPSSQSHPSPQASSSPPPAATPPTTRLLQQDLQFAPIPPSPLSRPLPASPTPLPEFPPSTPSEPEPRRPTAHDAVIAASDEEDGYSSDDSFVDILAGFLPSKKAVCPPAPTTSGPNPVRKSARDQPCLTPRAKRMATTHEFHSSPLTLQSKRKKYDFQSLLAQTKEDEATRASAQRFAALLEKEKKEKQACKQSSVSHNDVNIDDATGEALSFSQSTEDEGATARKLKKRVMDSAVAAVARGEDEDDEGGAAGGMRIAMALERADLGGRSRTYYFFEQTEPENALSTVLGRPFPAAAATGVWSILADKKDRARHFQSGFPFDIQLHFNNLPDDIFLWVLDEVCSETRRDLAAEYVKLLRVCDAQLQRLVTPARLQQSFRSLGATKDVANLTTHITLQPASSDPYPRRNWLCVENFLKLVGESSTSFTPSTRTTAMQILLRLGMDSVAVENFGLLHEWRWNVDLVARSVHRSDWTSFCRDVCASLYASTEKATLRYRAIAGLGPVNTQLCNSPLDLQPRTLDLKRRLASAFFFDDPRRADTRPEDTVTIRAIIDRLEEDEFQLNAETDFNELHALMMMLNVALGDASKHRVSTPPIAAYTTSERERDLSTEFDAEVDELAESMKSMATRVAPLSKGIHVSRMDAKNAMELIRERLLYQVRIRPVPKIRTFGQDDSDGSEVFLPKQQNFMKDFLKNGKKKAVTSGVDAEMVA